MKSCQVIAENRPFNFDLFSRFAQLCWQILLVAKNTHQKKGVFYLVLADRCVDINLKLI